MKKERRNAVQLDVPALNNSRLRDSASCESEFSEDLQSPHDVTEVITQVSLRPDKSLGPRKSSCDLSSIENSTFSTASDDHSDYSTDRRSRKHPGERVLTFKAPVMKRFRDFNQLHMKGSLAERKKNANLSVFGKASDPVLPNMDESDSDSSDIFVKRQDSSCHTPEMQHSSATTSPGLADDHEYSEKLVKSENDDFASASDTEDIFDRDQDAQQEESESRMGWIGEEECQELFNMTMSDIKSFSQEWWKRHSRLVQKQQARLRMPG